jgi:4-carboxymuconolactone decarboxylase
MAPGKEPRFPQLTVEQLNDTQRPLGEQIMKVSRVGLGGPYNPMLRSPVFGQKMFDLLYYLRWQTSVPLKLNEFAIVIIGRQWLPHAILVDRGISVQRRASDVASG